MKKFLSFLFTYSVKKINNINVINCILKKIKQIEVKSFTKLSNNPINRQKLKIFIKIKFLFPKKE